MDFVLRGTHRLKASTCLAFVGSFFLAMMDGFNDKQRPGPRRRLGRLQTESRFTFTSAHTRDDVLDNDNEDLFSPPFPRSPNCDLVDECFDVLDAYPEFGDVGEKSFGGVADPPSTSRRYRFVACGIKDCRACISSNIMESL